MLTITQITEAYGHGVFVRVSRAAPHGIKGEYDPSTLEVTLYPQNKESDTDLEITLLHEFIHARDDVRSARSYDNHEQQVENEAFMTYLIRPHVLEFIKDLYKIK